MLAANLADSAVRYCHTRTAPKRVLGAIVGTDGRPANMHPPSYGGRRIIIGRAMRTARVAPQRLRCDNPRRATPRWSVKSFGGKPAPARPSLRIPWCGGDLVERLRDGRDPARVMPCGSGPRQCSAVNEEIITGGELEALHRLIGQPANAGADPKIPTWKTSLGVNI